ncbi:hypothetical protein [Meiothermus granaticius]|uniref:hypothetical protein n=1 Tax=Meiothermus granaticius TaxID=863370 RepID=UPI0011926221|nr:hypothetical protein [Meiothermus granaticius]GEM88536.1 hypothetical protein MGR01S_31610 [Meiothermus granaticius NBRC 107808]
MDDWVFGAGSRGQGYGVWEAHSGCPIQADLANRGGFDRARDLLVDWLPTGVISDGAAEIKEALRWLGYGLNHVRCWFQQD